MEKNCQINSHSYTFIRDSRVNSSFFSLQSMYGLNKKVELLTLMFAMMVGTWVIWLNPMMEWYFQLLSGAEMELT